MFTPTTDYNQQMYRYLQAWRELLEQWMAMSAGMPFAGVPSAPPGMPFMPPVPPMPPMSPMPPMPPMPSVPAPPAPTDYTQQLFCYLQAWRQYLEQMTGALPWSPPTMPTQPTAPAQPATASQPQTTNGGNASRPPHRTEVDVPPPNDDGSRSNFLPKSATQSAVQQGSGPKPPPVVDVAPVNAGGSQVPPESRFSSASRVTRGPEAPERVIPPDLEFGGQLDRMRMDPGLAGPAVRSTRSGASRSASGTPAQRRVGTPFRSALNRVGENVAPQAAPKSLFSSRTARQQAQFRERGQTP